MYKPPLYISRVLIYISTDNKYHSIKATPSGQHCFGNSISKICVREAVQPDCDLIHVSFIRHLLARYKNASMNSRANRDGKVNLNFLNFCFGTDQATKLEVWIYPSIELGIHKIQYILIIYCKWYTIYTIFWTDTWCLIQHKLLH